LSGALFPLHARRVSFHIPASFRPGFTAGATLSRGISTLFERPLAYFGLTLTQGIPVAISLGLLYAVIGADGWAQAAATGTYPGWFWPIYLVACLASLAPFGAALHVASEQLAGRTVPFGDALAVGARRLFPLLGVYLLFTLMVTLGTMLVIVPGIILCTVYIVAMPIAVQERRGVLGALGQAARLSKGYRVTLFVIGVGYVAVAIGVYVGSLIIMFVVGMMAGLVAGGVVASILTVAVVALLYGALMALFPVLLAATYVGLREEKDGGSPEQVAGVFT
jgi:hypothetical protein